MPQLILVALVVGLGYYAWRTYKREAGRVAREVARKRAEQANSQGENLEADPDTGVYRPHQEDDDR